MASIVTQLAPLWQRLEQERGLPLGFMDRMAKVESGYNPNARNPSSSAGGLFQFINSTARNYGLTDKFDPVASSEAAARLASDNAAYLRKNGIEPTAGNLYLAHQQGPAGAVKLLRGGGAPASSVVGGAEAGLNGGGGLSASAMANKWTSKFADIDGTASASPFAPPKENTEMASPADMPAPGAVEAMGKSQFAIPGGTPSWGEADQEQLMMAMALLASAIPNGKPAPSITEVISPFMSMRSKREDRAYQRSRDERDHQLRLDEIRRAQSNSDRSFNLQERQANEPKYVSGPGGETIAIPQGGGAPTTVVPGRPMVQKFEDDAGNVSWRQYNPATQKWDPLSTGFSPTVPTSPFGGIQAAPQPAPAQPDMQGPPIPPEMLPPVAAAPGALAQPVSVIPTPPPGVNRQEWIKFHQQEYAKRNLPPGSEEVTGLRKEVQGLPSYKNVTSAAPVYNSMLEAAGRNDRASDVNMIYGMAKLMDPGSVVRESEMTIAQAIATLPEQLRNTVQSQITSQGRLSPEVREGIMREAYSRMGAYKQMFDQDADMYRGIIGRRGMNESDVLPGFKEFKEYKRKTDGGTGGAEGGTTPAPSKRDQANVDLINKSRAANGQPLKVLSPEHALTLKPGTRFEIPDGSGRIGVVPER